jgi:predicted nucleic acid-binding protein
MPKFLVETISYHRIRYVIECDSPEQAKDIVTMNEAEEMSQLHIDESITGCREIDDTEYLRIFDEDNDYLESWDKEQKLRLVNRIVEDQ